MDPASPVLAALYRGDADALAAALAADPPLDVFEAAALGRADRLREVLDADPGAVRRWTPDGFTPLHLAAFFAERPDAALLLIDRGAEVGARARNAMAVTPLNSAAARGRVAVVAALLDAGADPDAAQEAGFTALHAAAALGSRELADLLLERGADPARPNDAGQTPADLADDRGHPELARLLRGVSTQTDPER